MPEIMICCPTCGTAFKTGLRTEVIVLDSLEGTAPIPIRCPACKKLHMWRRRDAWVETATDNGRTDGRLTERKQTLPAGQDLRSMEFSAAESRAAARRRALFRRRRQQGD